MTTKFESVSIDVGGAQDYMSVVNTKTRRIKEVNGKVMPALDWNLPGMLIQDLAAYTLSCINMQRMMAINLNVAPRVMFTGLKADFQKELNLSFGNNYEVYDGTDNTSKSRTIPCLVIYSCYNSAKLWIF
jgi:hypothetical protein